MGHGQHIAIFGTFAAPRLFPAARKSLKVCCTNARNKPFLSRPATEAPISNSLSNACSRGDSMRHQAQ